MSRSSQSLAFSPAGGPVSANHASDGHLAWNWVEIPVLFHTAPPPLKVCTWSQLLVAAELGRNQGQRLKSVSCNILQNEKSLSLSRSPTGPVILLEHKLANCVSNTNMYAPSKQNEEPGQREMDCTKLSTICHLFKKAGFYFSNFHWCLFFRAVLSNWPKLFLLVMFFQQVLPLLMNFLFWVGAELSLWLAALERITRTGLQQQDTHGDESNTPLNTWGALSKAVHRHCGVVYGSGNDKLTKSNAGRALGC